MKLVNKILNRLNGLYYKQEYLCLAKGSFQQPLHAYLPAGKQIIKDITNQHLFIGYSPLIFALHSPSVSEGELTENIDIIFSERDIKPNEFLEKKDAIATLSFNKIRQLNNIAFYEAQKGDHGFLSKFHQSVQDWQNRLYNKKPGNVYLPGNLLKQVHIAYSIPRTISLVTVSDGQLYNLFPTDLHGEIDEEDYIVSLRQRGKAARQVESIKKVVVSEIDSSQYQTAYALGKNHMQELKPKVAFPFSDKITEQLHLPLPDAANFYRELELTQFFDHGIHRIFLFKILGKKQIEPHPSTLAHVHNVYATWRLNKGLPGNYLFR